jgi:hypothetical protein
MFFFPFAMSVLWEEHSLTFLASTSPQFSILLFSCYEVANLL